jgi:hypothetical protein
MALEGFVEDLLGIIWGLFFCKKKKRVLIQISF